METIINVLSEEAYNDCHIKNTVNAPLLKLAEYVKKFPKDTELIVYCASYICSASKNAWRLLVDIS